MPRFSKGMEKVVMLLGGNGELQAFPHLLQPNPILLLPIDPGHQLSQGVPCGQSPHRQLSVLGREDSKITSGSERKEV